MYPSRHFQAPVYLFGTPCGQTGFWGQLSNKDSVWSYWMTITTKSHNAPLVSVLRLHPISAAAFTALPQPPVITCSSSVCWNQTSAFESFTPTMLANENDGRGEENVNETFQKKSHVLAERCRSTEVLYPVFQRDGSLTTSVSTHPGISIFWFRTTCNVEVALGKTWTLEQRLKRIIVQEWEEQGEPTHQHCRALGWASHPQAKNLT